MEIFFNILSGIMIMVSLLSHLIQCNNHEGKSQHARWNKQINEIKFSLSLVIIVAKWSVRLFPERAVRVRVLAGDIVLCSWARHSTLTVPLSTQEYKWAPANCWGSLTNCVEVTWHPIQGEKKYS